jgi:hypothetical protein
VGAGFQFGAVLMVPQTRGGMAERLSARNPRRFPVDLVEGRPRSARGSWCEASTRNARSVADRTLLVPVTAECRARRGHRGRRCALGELRDGDQRDQRESGDKFPHDTSPRCGTLVRVLPKMRSFNRERVINYAIPPLPSCTNLAGIDRSCSFSTHYCGDVGAEYESSLAIGMSDG